MPRRYNDWWKTEDELEDEDDGPLKRVRYFVTRRRRGHEGKYEEVLAAEGIEKPRSNSHYAYKRTIEMKGEGDWDRNCTSRVQVVEWLSELTGLTDPGTGPREEALRAPPAGCDGPRARARGPGKAKPDGERGRCREAVRRLQRHGAAVPQGHGTCVSQPDKTGVIAANPLPRVKTLHKG